MRLLLIPLLISLIGCSSNEVNYSVSTQYQPNHSAYDLGVNFAKKTYYTIPREARNEYNQCVEFTLRELQVGEQCKWEVPNVSVGIVKLVKIDATGCHYMYNTMMYKGKQRNFQETACYNNGSKRWMFQNDNT